MLREKTGTELADAECIVNDFISWDIIDVWEKNLNILDEPTLFFIQSFKILVLEQNKTKNFENYWNPRSYNCEDQKALYYLKKNMVQGDLLIFLLFMQLVEKFYWNRIKQILSLFGSKVATDVLKTWQSKKWP